MSCNCKNMKGFDLAMHKAQAYEQKNNKKAAVFIVNKTTPSFTDLSNIDKVEGICCYFTTDGVEHELKKASKKAKEIVVKESEEMKIETVSIEEKPRKKSSKKK